jgi:hypothetical protein
MSTNVDKSLYQAPTGLDDLEDGDMPVMEIEVILPTEDDEEGAEDELPVEPLEFEGNIAERMTSGELGLLSTELLYSIEMDLNGRKDWETTFKEGLVLLGLKTEERTEPWDGASGVVHPMITEAVVRFQSEAIMETFPAGGPVRTVIVGKETPEKKQSALRVAEDMNYQLTDKMVEFRSEHERMLWALPAVGSAFKKVYYNADLKRPTSLFVSAEDVILPYGVSDLAMCERLTHRMRKTKNEMERLQTEGFYREVELGEPGVTHNDVQDAKDKEAGQTALLDERYEVYEVLAMLALGKYGFTDDDELDNGLALPYVVTIEKGTDTVLSIRRNWLEEDAKCQPRQHFVHYMYIPGFGAYGFGLFHLIGGFARGATSLMRQLIDAGTLSNLPGGLKTKGLRVKGDDTPIAPGEWRDVDVGSGTIKENIMPLPYKEPSLVLAALLEKIVEEGRRFAATADMKISDMSAQAPVGTTLALLERQLKVLTAVQARVHYSLRQELKIIAGLIRDYTDEDYNYEPDTGRAQAKREDYSAVDIIPVSDPNAATLSQRVVQYQAVIQMAQMAPEIYDLPQLHRQMLEIIGVPNVDKILPLPEDMKPRDPVSENMEILKCAPVAAFVEQDHEAHIKVHMMASQDPIVMQLVGQNPKAPQIMGAMQAHIAEHVGFAYKQKIEAQLGMALPADDVEVTAEIAQQLAQLIAQAGARVLEESKRKAAEQQAQAAAQDPVVQMQQKELEIKEREVGVKEKKVMVDGATAADKLEIERLKVEGQLELQGAKLGVEIKSAQDKMEKEGFQIGLEIAQAQEGALERATAPRAPATGDEK